MAKKDESIQDLVDRMVGSGAANSGVSVLARDMRKAIDREGLARNVLILDGDFKKRYDEFVKAVKEADGKTVEFRGDTYTKASAQKIINTVEGQGESSERMKYREMGEKNRDLMGKLFADLPDTVQLGHRDLSIQIGHMSLLLKADAFGPNDPRRPALRALMVVAQQIDQITEQTEMSLDEFVELQRDLLNSDYDVGAIAQIAVDAFTGVDGEVVFTMENEKLNQLKGHLAKQLGKTFAAVVRGDMRSFERLFSGYDISNLRGSPNIKELLGNQIRDILDPKTKKHKPGKISTKGDKKAKGAAGGQKAKLKSAALQKYTLPQKAKRKKQRGAMESPIKLIALINAKLPETVAKNMGAPRLENRTGRFASSPRIVDVTTTKGGFPSFGYTYEKSPYSVFESTSGSRFASTDRDPRDLIQLSIREIATQFSIGRFYTRRV